MEDLKQVMDALSHITFGMVLIATIVVRVTPTSADDEKLSLFLAKIHNFMSLFPTLGKNPMTELLLKEHELMQSEAEVKETKQEDVI